MRIMCWYCNKIVSSEALDDFAFRAIAICPECIEKSPEAENHPLNKDAVLTSDMHTDSDGRSKSKILGEDLQNCGLPDYGYLTRRR